MINNFDKLKDICKWEAGTYYKFVALCRKKDYKDASEMPGIDERGEIFIRQWFIDSEETLNKYKPVMLHLCNRLGCRLYMTLDKKSIKKTLFKIQEQVNEQIKLLCFNPEQPISIRRLSKFSSSASQMAECSASDKYWLLDYDADKVGDLEKLTPELFEKSLPFYVTTLPTVNGYHIIYQRKFDLRAKLADLVKNVDYIEVKENALTLIYFSGDKTFQKDSHNIDSYKIPSCCEECGYLHKGDSLDEFYYKCDISEEYFNSDFDITKKREGCPLEEK